MMRALVVNELTHLGSDYHKLILNLLMTSVPHHIETSQLICSANQLTGFYIMGNTGR